MFHSYVHPSLARVDTVKFSGVEQRRVLRQAVSVNDNWQTVREKNLLGILCGIAIVAVLIATLWPFNPFPPNRISWLSEANGIRFGGPGLVVSKAPLTAAGAEPGKSCSLELLIRPASVEGSYTILSFYTANNPEQFLVRQWTDGLLVRHDIVNSQNEVKRTKFDVDHAFQQSTLVLLTITFGPSGTVVYLNASQAQVFSRFRILQSELLGQIVIGTSAVEYQPWPGEVRGLAIYSKELTAAEVSRHYENWMAGRGFDPPDLDGAIAHYAFAEGAGREIRNAVASGPDLEIPEYFGVPHKALLTSAVKEFGATRRYVLDVLLNIGGFIPLGFILCVYLSLTRTRRKAILSAALAGAILSLVIEVLQAYIPQRVSGTTDIITNTLGSVLGALLARPSMARTILGRTKLITTYGNSASPQD
jgi:VanZ family protein